MLRWFVCLTGSGSCGNRQRQWKCARSQYWLLPDAETWLVRLGLARPPTERSRVRHPGVAGRRLVWRVFNKRRRRPAPETSITFVRAARGRRLDGIRVTNVDENEARWQQVVYRVWPDLTQRPGCMTSPFIWCGSAWNIVSSGNNCMRSLPLIRTAGSAVTPAGAIAQ